MSISVPKTMYVNFDGFGVMQAATPNQSNARRRAQRTAGANCRFMPAAKAGDPDKYEGGDGVAYVYAYEIKD